MSRVRSTSCRSRTGSTYYLARPRKPSRPCRSSNTQGSRSKYAGPPSGFVWVKRRRPVATEPSRHARYRRGGPRSRTAQTRHSGGPNPAHLAPSVRRKALSDHTNGRWTISCLSHSATGSATESPGGGGDATVLATVPAMVLHVRGVGSSPDLFRPSGLPDDGRRSNCGG